VSPLKIKIPSKNMRENPTNATIIHSLSGAPSSCEFLQLKGKKFSVTHSCTLMKLLIVNF
jgi:hypothetical protein